MCIGVLAAAARFAGTRTLRTASAALVAVLGILLLLRTLDLGSFLAFGRRFSPLVEWHLIGAGWHLASTSIGLAPALGIVLLAAVVLIVLCLGLYRGFVCLGRCTAYTVVVIMVAAASCAVGAWKFSTPRAPVSVRVAPELFDRVQALHRSVEDQRAFLQQLDEAEASAATPTFTALQGKDIVVIFVESYGHSFLTDDTLGPRAEAALDGMASRLARAGLQARSAWIEAPTRGGRSWLSHASFAAGLPVDNQARFDRLIASSHRSLYGLLSDAGWTSFGIVPAIERAWPEGSWYEFDEIHDRDRLDYRGERFGYATMPDQYTLSAFETRIKPGVSGPVAVEFALISSHGPWAPLPHTLAWDVIGDGAVFDGSQRNDEHANWHQRDSVREFYVRSMEYTLGVVGEYIERYGKNRLILVLGDHQPPTIISGWDKNANTPVHVISDDPTLLQRLPEPFTDGLFPTSAADLSMWSLRELLTTRFERP